ncbi:MAG: hypothetical protein LBC18_03275 [Opitutaceae bacterium]|jgi:hypothetical protein|nr:hypothetical protein [Opitutaceae bacterium]
MKIVRDTPALLPGLKLRRTPRELLEADVAALKDALSLFHDWTTTAGLLALLPPGWTERRVRMAASADPELLSFPGSPGYKLTRDATPEEIHRAVDTLQSQARVMFARATTYSRWYHRYRARRMEGSPAR